MTEYPYFIPVMFDAGLLKKIFNDKKFKTYTNCLDATVKYIEKNSRLKERQILILEYKGQYDAKIVNILNYD